VITNKKEKNLTDPKVVARSLLPTEDDDDAIKKNICILISRILWEYGFFQNIIWRCY